MGQCASICSPSSTQNKNEVRVDISNPPSKTNNNDKPSTNKTNSKSFIHKIPSNIDKYSTSPIYSKLIYIQLRMKRFLKRIRKQPKSNNKPSAPLNNSNNINVNINLNVNMNNNSSTENAMLVPPQEAGVFISGPSNCDVKNKLNNIGGDGGSSIHNIRNINTGISNINGQSCSNINDNSRSNIMNVNINSNLNNGGNISTSNVNLSSNANQRIESNVLVIPSVKSGLTDNLILLQDPFILEQSNSIANPNDPRNGPFDGKIHSHPEVTNGDWAYTGEWLNGKRNGLGVLYLKEMFKYIGEFKDNKENGYGRLIREDGDIYTGYWKDSQAEGIGIYTTNRRANFQGYWQQDKQNGFGIEYWPRGSSYKGGYVDGYKQGIGVLNFEGNGGYEGEFDNGNICGVGTFYFVDNRKYEGEWKYNKMHGFGIITWPDGKFFEGSFYEDKKEGFGVFYSQKKIYLGMWKNSQLEGETIIIESGKIRKQFWENGKIVRQLPPDTPIFFEKYVEEIKKYKEEMIQQNNYV